MTNLDQAKPFPITKRQVWEAYKRVKANGGAAGVDGQSLEGFTGDLKGNLYKVWNRLASGSYMPPPVKRVDIPKAIYGRSPYARLFVSCGMVKLQPYIRVSLGPRAHTPNGIRWMTPHHWSALKALWLCLV